MTTVTWEEACDQANRELAHRAEQMTQDEYQEVLHDRTRELLGQLPLARLRDGKRLSSEQFFQLASIVGRYLEDFEHVATLGDARFYGRRLVIMFRLSARPDVSFSIELTPTGQMDLTRAGQDAAVRAYDVLTPEYVDRLIKAKPITP